MVNWTITALGKPWIFWWLNTSDILPTIRKYHHDILWVILWQIPITIGKSRVGILPVIFPPFEKGPWPACSAEASTSESAGSEGNSSHLVGSTCQVKPPFFRTIKFERIKIATLDSYAFFGRQLKHDITYECTGMRILKFDPNPTHPNVDTGSTAIQGSAKRKGGTAQANPNKIMDACIISSLCLLFCHPWRILHFHGKKKR